MGNVFNEKRETVSIQDSISDFSVRIGLTGLVLFSITNTIIFTIKAPSVPTNLYARWIFACLWSLALISSLIYKGKIHVLFKQLLIISVALGLTLVSISENIFYSDVLFWYALLPIAGGLISQKNGVTTGFLAALTAMIITVITHQSWSSADQLVPLTEFLVNKRIMTIIQIIFFMTLFSYLAHTLLLKMTTKVQVDNTTLKHLLNTISTKIETNISEIKDISSGLQSKSLTKTQSERLNSIHRASSNIQEITKNIKILKQIDQKDTMINFTPVNASLVIDQVNFIYSTKLKDKGLSLIIENSLSTHTRIWADEASLNNQIISNFISNAIKFSWKDHNILLKFEEINEDIQITISDSGIGIPNTLLANLFSIDKRTNRKGTAGEGGTGFGMPIAKSSIEEMGGSLSVKTQDISTHPDSSGTSFIITLKKASMLKEN